MKGNMAGMMKQIQKMLAEMQKTQDELANKTVTAESGGGLVKATCNGQKEIVALEIDEEIAQSGDKEMMEDLIVAAVNKSLEAAGKWRKRNLVM